MTVVLKRCTCTQSCAWGFSAIAGTTSGVGRGLEAPTKNTRATATSTETYFKDMLSTPTAIPNWICCVLMALETVTIDCKPDEHSLFTVEMGTSTGMPAAIAAAREM